MTLEVACDQQRDASNRRQPGTAAPGSDACRVLTELRRHLAEAYTVHYETGPFRHPTPISSYTAAGLKKCMEPEAVEELLPRELWLNTNTWRVDVMVQQEERNPRRRGQM
jgi:hypothetical protein